MKKQMAVLGAVAMMGTLAMTEDASATKISGSASLAKAGVKKGIASRNWAALRARLKNLRGRLGKWKQSGKRFMSNMRNRFQNLRKRTFQFRNNLRNRFQNFRQKIVNRGKALRTGGRAIFDRYAKKFRGKIRTLGKNVRAGFGKFMSNMRRRIPAAKPIPKPAK
jgi:hypothetical protein